MDSWFSPCLYSFTSALLVTIVAERRVLLLLTQPLVPAKKQAFEENRFYPLTYLVYTSTNALGVSLV